MRIDDKKYLQYACIVARNIVSLQRNKKQGVLAHLARARHWQCRGERFESAILHFHYLSFEIILLV